MLGFFFAFALFVLYFFIFAAFSLCMPKYFSLFFLFILNLSIFFCIYFARVSFIYFCFVYFLFANYILFVLAYINCNKTNVNYVELKIEESIFIKKMTFIRKLSLLSIDFKAPFTSLFLSFFCLIII